MTYTQVKLEQVYLDLRPFPYKRVKFKRSNNWIEEEINP